MDGTAKKTDIHSKNAAGSTPLDVLLEDLSGVESEKTYDILMSAGADEPLEMQMPRKKTQQKPPHLNGSNNNSFNETLLVVAILMATVAFQAALNPPGGFWQEDGSHVDTSSSPQKVVQHIPGQPIMSSTKPRCHDAFSALNYLTLYSSMIVIVLQVSRSFSHVWSMVFTFFSVFTMLLSYQISLIMFLRKDYPIIVSFLLAVQLLFSMIIIPLGTTKCFFQFRMQFRKQFLSLSPKKIDLPTQRFTLVHGFKDCFFRCLTNLCALVSKRLREFMDYLF